MNNYLVKSVKNEWLKNEKNDYQICIKLIYMVLLTIVGIISLSCWRLIFAYE